MNNKQKKRVKDIQKSKILVIAIIIIAIVCGISIYTLCKSRETDIAIYNEDITQEETVSQDKTRLEQETIRLEQDQKDDSKNTDEAQMMTIYDIEEGYIRVPYIPELEHHNYDWKYLNEENGYKYYEDNSNNINTPNNRSKIGIDVSKYQGDIDYKQVKESGIEFVIIRMGYRGYGNGKLVVDEYYYQNVEKALEVGLEVGVYIFSQAINVDEAIEEANFVYDNIKDYDITYPVVFDTEEIKFDDARTDDLTVPELTNITIAFCERIKKLGYKPMIYANAKWLTTKLDLTKLQEYDIWYADYQEEPIYPYQFHMWQYTDEGRVPGIDGYVDLNISFE